MLTFAAAVCAAVVLVPVYPAGAAVTANAWVDGNVIRYEAGIGQVNSVAVQRITTTLGVTLWQFTDVVALSAGPGCFHPNRGTSTVVWCNPGSTSLMAVYTRDLDDTVKLGHPDTYVFSGSGNDTIYTSTDPSSAALIFGEEGADRILSGGSRDDIDGGPGLDTVSYEHRLEPVCGDLGSLAPPNGGPLGDPGACGVHDEEDVYLGYTIENLIGSPYDDELWGNKLSNKLFGGAGVDIIYANAGDDLLFGGPGDDQLHGAYGSDVLYGEAGNDHLHVEGVSDGFDVHDGGDGYDECIGAMFNFGCEVISPPIA